MYRTKKQVRLKSLVWYVLEMYKLTVKRDAAYYYNLPNAQANHN